MQHQQFEAFASQMRGADLPPILIQTFHHYYKQLVEGHSGLVAETDIEPVASLPDAAGMGERRAAGRAALERTVVIKLNGGLGTSMGLERAKSLLPARGELTFLDIIARQTLQLRRDSGARLPLLFMNSFSTDDDTIAALAAYPDLRVGDLPLTFLQHKVPKVLRDGLSPVSVDQYGEMAWCPPGHGDLYVALQSSGLLDQLLETGYEYAFVSNADNLGAVPDEAILGYMAQEELPFLMEVADRTAADSKGGHLARRNGRLMLREVAQCPAADMSNFQDITRHRYFNTNNIWLHLPSLQYALEQHQGVLPLPLIRNQKTVDPRDGASPPVVQLETAMGAAIEVFDGAGAVRVPRTRFSPVKLCSDLLVLWSDAYVLTPDFHVVVNEKNRYGLPLVQLDPRFYKLIDQLRERFAAGPPSLTGCERLTVEGDVFFEAGVVVRGTVRVTAGDAPRRIAAGAVLDNSEA